MRLRSTITTFIVLFALQVSAQYRGGMADGVSLYDATGKNPLPVIYAGGNNDGISISAVSGQNIFPNIYSGGNNDGVTLATAAALNPLVNIYTGGNHDGFANTNSNNQHNFPQIYPGGNNDGFSFLQLTNANPFLNIYTGGASDGWATLRVNGLNPFTTLAVQLLEFTGTRQQNDILLKWKTVTETANDHFEIERSNDGGRTFSVVGIVPGALNSNTIKSYGFTDYDAVSNNIPVLYYRLKITDSNGRFIYSAVLQFKTEWNEPAYVLFPNPGNGKFHLQVNGVIPSAGFAWQIVTASGISVKKGSIHAAVTSFDISGLVSGVYWMQIIPGDGKPHVIQIILNH